MSMSHADAAQSSRSYLAPSGARSWLGSLDHKRIALLYLATIGAVLAVGVAYAFVLGLERLRPGAQLLDDGGYRALMSAHGTVMVFLVVVPVLPAVLGNFVLPLMLGAKNLAFPRLDRAGLHLYWVGAAIALVGLMAAGPRSGWTFAEAYDPSVSGGGVMWVMLGVLLVAASGLLGGINTIVSIHKLRTTGLSWSRLPLLVWAAYAASVIAVLAPAPLAMNLTLAAAERALHIGVFDPRLGGDPLLFRHLFWFYAHPTLFGAMLWGLGVASELLGVHAHRRLFGYGVLAALFFVLAGLSFTQWGIHLVSAGTSALSVTVSSMLALLALVPMVLVLGNWLLTLRGGSISLNAPMLFALALMVNLTVWIASGVALNRLDLGAFLRGTSFEVAHIHYGLAGGALTAFLGGLLHWWPKLTGHVYDPKLARLGAVGVFAGLNLTFLGQFAAGLRGTVSGRIDHGPGMHGLDALHAAGTWVLIGSIGLTAWVLLDSLRSAARAEQNPWGAGSLEWQTASPPPVDNFDHHPEVHAGPYEPAPAAG